MSLVVIGAGPHAVPPPARPIDPFAALVEGAYVDDLVAVRPAGEPVRGAVRATTAHFDVARDGGRVEIGHRVPTHRLDDDLAGLVEHELFGPGWLRGTDLFERVLTGLVRSSDPDPDAAWEGFYRHTLTRIEAVLHDGPGGRTADGHGSIADYAPVYERAESLVGPGSVLELGSCFGFLSLRLAAAGRRTTASDLSAGTMRLLDRIAPRLGVSLECGAADAARYPAPARCADTVLAIHLLEHLEPDHGDRVVTEALRLTRRRLVVAVPLEDVATEAYGHVRTVSLDDLAAWGASCAAAVPGASYEVSEHHGGWLVVNR
ncbi:SAM-dependent methyltransferase [Marmoricola endophyticus]|uniref:SAM-dependent methyltransferase n=1 Tax=Marmoricola endophyticus TaxID=2040280 RepID=A0A917F7M2_9ACTN|nr:mycofactocin oligosaccharide methyltransferase MftM [Marmoricola endophyticus]GGF53668.1 SAM-dependent methyltransferase [Marmoricola endophyticus]